MSSNSLYGIFLSLILTDICKANAAVKWERSSVSEIFLEHSHGFTSISNGYSSVQCCAMCNLDELCELAQFSAQDQVCRLINNNGCRNYQPGSQLTVYSKRPLVDISNTIVATNFHQTNGAAGYPASLAFDGDISTMSSSHAGTDTYWTVTFGASVKISQIYIIQARYYGQVLDVNLSGTILKNGPCFSTGMVYAQEECHFRPGFSCWVETSGIHITSQNDNLGIDIYEIKIFY